MPDIKRPDDIPWPWWRIALHLSEAEGQPISRARCQQVGADTLDKLKWKILQDRTLREHVIDNGLYDPDKDD